MWVIATTTLVIIVSLFVAYMVFRLKRPRDYIVIVTHKGYGEALDKLLATLKEWPKEDIIIVANGDLKERIFKREDGCLQVSTQKNLYEYTAFFVPEIIRASKSDAFMLLHDTSEAGHEFLQKTRNQFSEFRKHRCNILWLSSSGQCNVCIYDASAVAEAKRVFKDVLTIDKMLAIHMEHNGTENSPKRWNLVQRFHSEATKHIGTCKPYSSGVLRNVLYFPSINLKKYYVHVSKTEEHPQVP